MENGNSLIEVLVAMTLFAIITSGVGTLLQRSMEIKKLSEQREKAAFDISNKTEMNVLNYLSKKIN